MDLKPGTRGTALKLAIACETDLIMKLYVGNLASETSEADLRALLEPFGTIVEINIINDRMTGRPRGFAFVTMGSVTEGRAAIDGRRVKG